MSETLRIRLSDSHFLDADCVSVQCYSSCARGLPAAAEEWDLSRLLLEGQPVQPSTVVCWLNTISQHMNYEPVLGDQKDSPEHTFAGLAQLLAFADAVGTIKGLMRAVDAQVSAAALVAEVQIGAQQLRLTADSYYHIADNIPLDLLCYTSCKYATVATASSAADKIAMRQHFVQQLETLLYLAHKLQLPQLQRVMRSCIFCNSFSSSSLLFPDDVLRAVMSARVVDAAAGCGAAQDALIASCSNEMCSFRLGENWRQLLKPLDLTTAQKEPVVFKAEVMQDACSLRKGQIVDVRLDVLGRSRMDVYPSPLPGSFPLPFVVNLALGRHMQPRPGS